MKKMLIMMIAVTLVLLGSCGVSIFDDLDQIPLDTGDADSMLKAAESDSFYDQLAEDPALRDEAIATLEQEGSADSQALISQIYFETTEAGNVVNNVVSTALDLKDSGEPNPADIMAAIFPDSVTSSEETFDETINALTAMASALNATGSQVDNLSADNNTGDLAQMALVATTVTIMSSLVTDAGADLYSVVTAADPAQEFADTVDTGDNPFDDSATLETIFDNEGYTGTYSLISAAGLNLEELGL